MRICPYSQTCPSPCPGRDRRLDWPLRLRETTLLNIISGLTAPDAGTVEGADGRLSYMFQSARLLPWRTVEENIRLVREEAPAGKCAPSSPLWGWRGLNAIIPANSPAAWPAGAPWPGHSTSAVRFS